MNIRIVLFILAGGILLALVWKPIADSFSDTFQTEENRRAKRLAARSDGDAPEDRLLSPGTRPDSSAAARSPARPAPTEPEITHLFSSEAFLDSVQAQLENLPRLRGKNIMFHGDIHFYRHGTGRLEIEIQDPDAPENLDKYSYSGRTWGQPEPVKTYASRDFRKALIPLERIRFSTALKVLETTRQIADSLNAGSVSNHIYFNNWPVFKRREWISTITSTRRDYDLRFDMDGHLKEFKRR